MEKSVQYIANIFGEKFQKKVHIPLWKISILCDDFFKCIHTGLAKMGYNRDTDYQGGL